MVRMLVVLLPVAVALVGGCAYLVVSMAPPRTRVGRWLALWVAVWTEVVVTTEILSLLDAVTWFGFLVCYVVFGGVAVIVWIVRGKPRVRLLTLPERIVEGKTPRDKRHKKKRQRKRREVRTRGPVLDAFLRHPALGVLLVVLAMCALVNLALAVGLPVNNYDANTYHLSRIGYWIQYGSTGHYFTYNERQNYSPPNAEFGLLSLIIFARAEWPAPLAQYAAYFVCLAAVYFVARQLGASDAAALFAALLLGTMTEVILQSTIPKNGLIASSFLACAVAFALVGLRARASDSESSGAATRALVWSGLAVGLAFGTKATGPLFVPGLAIAGVVIAASGGAKRWLGRAAVWAACCAAGIVLLGSTNYARNYADYGSVSGPPKTIKGHRILKPTPRTLLSNLARYGYYACDYSGLMPRPLARALTAARARSAPAIFRALGITANAPEINFMGSADTFPVDAETGRFDRFPRLHEDTAWFGPIVFFVAAPLVLVHLVYSPLRKRWARFAVALTPVAYWLLVCTLLRYQAWGGRFFVTAAVAGAPLLSLAYMPTRVLAVKHAVTWVLVVVGLSTALTATFYNTMKPIVPKSPRDEETGRVKDFEGVLTLGRDLLKCRASPSAYVLEVLPAEVFPEQMTLGVVLGSDEWDWYLFGPRLRRKLVPLPADSKRVSEAFQSGEVDMVVIRKTNRLATMPPILGERPVVSDLDMAPAYFWSFLCHRDEHADLLFPARDWRPPPGTLWVGADEQYVPVRRLPEGHVVVAVEPNPEILKLTPLVFAFYAGDREIYRVTFAAPGQQAVALPWKPGPRLQDQLLRIRVSSPEPEIDAQVQGVHDVYLLSGPPTFLPSQPGAGRSSGD
jgi:hypothetical protein